MIPPIRLTSKRKGVSVTISTDRPTYPEKLLTLPEAAPQDRDPFLWGVATSAFQLEGSPFADWTSWDDILSEKPDITNHYNVYKEDLALLQDLGVNAYRFSIEWSRIQPHEKVWDDEAIAHYQDIIDILISK